MCGDGKAVSICDRGPRTDVQGSAVGSEDQAAFFGLGEVFGSGHGKIP